MEKRRLGKTGLDVGVLGFGGAEIGFFDKSADLVAGIVSAAIEAGVNLFDTAAAYWNSEQLLGEALSANRRDIVIASKCGALDGFTRFDWSKRGLLETITRSLRHLRTDYLDIAQLHSCDPGILTRGEVFEALIVAKEKGYTRFTGYSGDGEGARAAVESGFFDTLQTSISIADQESIAGNLPLALEREMGIIAKRPLANVVWRNEDKPEDEYHHEYWDRILKLDYPFLAGGLEESAATALRFTLSVEGVTSAIVGTTRPSRMRLNAAAAGAGPFASSEFDAIRKRWDEVAGRDWTAQI